MDVRDPAAPRLSFVYPVPSALRKLPPETREGAETFFAPDEVPFESAPVAPAATPGDAAGIVDESCASFQASTMFLSG